MLRNLRIVYCSTTCRAALRFLKKHGPVDVVFCDIELKDENGLREAEKFFEYTAFFLLITVHDQFKVQAWEKGVHGYIMKPAQPREIRKRLDDLIRIRQTGRIMDDPDQTVFIKDVSKPLPTKIVLGDIYSITVDARLPNIICLNTVSSGMIKHRKSLTNFKKRFLDTGLLVQLSQSALVGKRHVSHIQGDLVHLSNGFAYPVSKRYLGAIDTLSDHLNLSKGDQPDE